MRQTITALMFLGIIATGCGGGSGGDSPPRLGSLDSKLFVADAGNASIASTINADPPAGTLVFDRVVDGLSTNLSNSVRSLEIDRARKLMYVANGGSILVFDHIGTADGDVAPVRTIRGVTAFGNISALYLDVVNDVLYAADLAVGIWMIHNASSATGTLTPDRELTQSFGGTFQIRDLFVDTGRNILYVSISAATEQILVFDNARGINDTTAALVANRIVTPSPTMPVGSIFVDTGNNQLYMTDTASGTVRVFNDASSADGSVSASRTVDWGTAATDIVIDTVRDRLYAINTGNVFVVNGVSTVNGVVTAKVLFAPGGSVFTALAVNP